MRRSAGSFTYAVRAVGVGHHRERLVRRDERVDQRFAVLEVHVVVARAVHEEQVAAQVLREGDR